MRLCSVTMVFKNYWQFGQWVECNARTVGRENCFVVSHGADPEISKIAAGCNVLQVPRSEKSLVNFDQDRMASLDALRDSLLNYYDAVIQSDSDELVFTADGSLPELLEPHKDIPALAALGLELVERKRDRPFAGSGLFQQRKGAVFTGHYSKACVVFRKGVALRKHGYVHRSVKRGTNGFVLEPQLFLCHIRYANQGAEHAADEARTSFEMNGIKSPSGAWREPDQARKRFYRRYHKRQEASFFEAYTQAAMELRNGEVDRDYGLAVAKKRIMDYRFEVPDSFEDVC